MKCGGLFYRERAGLLVKNLATLATRPSRVHGLEMLAASVITVALFNVPGGSGIRMSCPA